MRIDRICNDYRQCLAAWGLQVSDHMRNRLWYVPIRDVLAPFGRRAGAQRVARVVRIGIARGVERSAPARGLGHPRRVVRRADGGGRLDEIHAALRRAVLALRPSGDSRTRGVAGTCGVRSRKTNLHKEERGRKGPCVIHAAPARVPRQSGCRPDASCRRPSAIAGNSAGRPWPAVRPGFRASRCVLRCLPGCLPGSRATRSPAPFRRRRCPP